MDYITTPLILKHMIHIDYCNYSLSSSKWSVSFKWVQLCHQYVDCEFEFDTTLCDKDCQWLTAGWRFFPVSPTNKIDRHDITEVLLKVALNIITSSYCVLKLLGFFCCACHNSEPWFSISYISSSMIVGERW